MYLLALRIGLTSNELRTIPYSYLVWLIHCYAESMNVEASGKPDDKPRKATDQDIMALIMM